MKGNSLFSLLSIVTYLVLVLLIGIWYGKRNNDENDFYLGGRRLGPFVTAMSAEASDMSSWLLMGLPGLAYLTGLANAAWTAIGLAVGTYLNWALISKRIRRYSAYTKDAITIPDFFSRRYGDNKNILMLISSVIIIVFFIPYTASGFAACGKLLSVFFGIDYITAMLIGAVVIVLYTCMGGFLAASVSDLMQSVIMSIAIVVVLTFGIHSAGGIGEVINNARGLEGYLSLFSSHVPETNTSIKYGFLDIISTLSWGLGYFGMPHILLRFMAIEDEKKLTLSRRIASIWVVISLSISILIGIVGLAISNSGAIKLLNGAESESIIIYISELLSQKGVFFAIIGGLILAGILAATMSTADSQLLAASSSVSRNIISEFMGISLSKKASVIAARITVLIVSLIAVFIASNPNSSIFNIVSFAWAGFGATFGPAVLAALFWRRSNMYGVIAGMLVGGITIFVWKCGLSRLGGIFALYELLPAFLLALATIIIVSLLTKSPSKEVTELFDRVNMK